MKKSPTKAATVVRLFEEDRERVQWLIQNGYGFKLAEVVRRAILEAFAREFEKRPALGLVPPKRF